MKNSQKLRYVALGAVLSLLISATTVTALVASGEFLINTVNIGISGEQVAAKGENYIQTNGTQVPYSISYKGTTYLPLRAIGELVGEKVSWDGATGTAGVGVLPEVKPAPDPNRKPDITLAEIKSMFSFKLKAFVYPRDWYDYEYNGDLEVKEFLAYWNTINKEDIDIALKEWILELSESENQTVEKDITITLLYDDYGSSYSCGYINYGILKGFYK